MNSLQSIPQSIDQKNNELPGPDNNTSEINKTLLKISFCSKEKLCPDYANIDNDLKVKIGYFFFNLRPNVIQKLSNMIIATDDTKANENNNRARTLSNEIDIEDNSRSPHKINLKYFDIYFFQFLINQKSN